MQVVHLHYKSTVERALKQRLLDKLSRSPLVVNSRNILIEHFVDELSAIKEKRSIAGLQEIGEEPDVTGNEEKGKEEKKTLVLQPPPLGRERSSSAPDETTEMKREEGKPMLTRSASVKVKKSVSFSPATSFDGDQRTEHSSLKDVSKDKRKKRPLQKQESIEEHEDHNSKPILTVDSTIATGPFGHQRDAAFRSGKMSRRFTERFRAAAKTVIAERRPSAAASSNTIKVMQSKTESKSVGVVESRRQRFELKGFVTDDVKSDTDSDRKESQASLTPPIAKPESVKISLSPYSSPAKGSPLQDTDDRYQGILNPILPLPPVLPVKVSVENHQASSSANATNGSVSAELNWQPPDFDVERGRRLSRTRWWHKIYSEEDSQTISAFGDCELDRETIV